jgi:DNA-binding ferritin-like protein
MKFLNSLLETLKKFWYFFVILALTALVLVVGFIENSKMTGLTNSIKDIIGNYKKQVKTIDKLGDKKAASDKETVQTYIDREKELQAEREAALAKINAKKIKVVEELKDKPTDELAKKMKDEFKL